MIYDLFTSFFVYFCIFCAYLELSPQIGNVWFRVGADGFRHINLSSLFYTIFSPFRIPELWYPKNWDLNYFVGVFATFGIISMVKDYNKTKHNN